MSPPRHDGFGGDLSAGDRQRAWRGPGRRDGANPQAGSWHDGGSGDPRALKFTAAATDGESLWAYRWSCDGHPPTLYFREVDGNLLVVSEPIDDKTQGWREVPKGCSLVARKRSETRVECLNEAMALVAA